MNTTLLVFGFVLAATGFGGAWALVALRGAQRLGGELLELFIDTAAQILQRHNFFLVRAGLLGEPGLGSGVVGAQLVRLGEE